MPAFLKYNPSPGSTGSLSNNNAVLPYPLQTSQVPVFLIPGVFRNASEMLSLAQHLDNIYMGTRPIYIFHDEHVDTSATRPTQEKYNSPVIDAIQQIVPFGPLPYVIIGYSDGCKEAVRTAKALKSKDQEVRVCLIDGMSETLTKSYFNSHSISPVSDLINIVNYAAQLSLLPNLLTLDPHEMESIFCLTAQSRLEHLAYLVMNKNQTISDEQYNTFLGYIYSARQVFAANPIDEDTENNIDSLTVFLTNETKRKYLSMTGKWETQANSIMSLHDFVLENESHTNLMKAANAERLAALIHTGFLQHAITLDQLFNGQIEYLRREFESASSKSSHSNRCSPGNSGRDFDDDTTNFDLDSPDHSPSSRRSPHIYAPISATIETFINPVTPAARPSTPLGGPNRFYATTNPSNRLDGDESLLNQLATNHAHIK